MAQMIASGAARPAQRSRTISWKFLVGGLLILGVIAYVAFSSFQSNTVYYFTLQEFHTQRASLAGQTIRINGPLDQSSIQLDQKNMVLNFNLKDGDIVQPVVYRGVVPDTLKTGESVVAEGRLDSNGVFQADQILVKCPSKYESQPSGQ